MSNFVDYGNMTALMTGIKSAIDNAGGGGGSDFVPVPQYVADYGAQAGDSNYKRGYITVRATGLTKGATTYGQNEYTATGTSCTVNNGTFTSAAEMYKAIADKKAKISVSVTLSPLDYSGSLSLFRMMAGDFVPRVRIQSYNESYPDSIELMMGGDMGIAWWYTWLQLGSDYPAYLYGIVTPVTLPKAITSFRSDIIVAQHV